MADSSGAEFSLRGLSSGDYYVCGKSFDDGYQSACYGGDNKTVAWNGDEDDLPSFGTLAKVAVTAGHFASIEFELPKAI